MNRTLVILTISLFLINTLVRCEKDKDQFPYNECIKGTVIIYEQCAVGSLIQLEKNIGGKNINLTDSLGNVIKYDNVVKSPGIYPKGNIYFKARPYNSEEDASLFSVEYPCQLVYAPYDVPIIVITDYSTSNCF